MGDPMFGSISKLLGGIFGGLSPLSGWLIRLPFAAVFLYHGVTKFTQDGGIATFAGYFGEGTGPLVIAILVGAAEILAGLGAIVGGLQKNDFGDAVTRLSGLAAAPVMIGALLLVRIPGPWNAMEFDVMLLALALVLLIRGKNL